MIARRTIFVHIPKCAGLTINRALFGCLGGAHKPIASYKAYLTKREFDTFFKFTFVRNPWDRVVSAYHFLREGGLSERDRRLAEATVFAFPDFETFVEGFLGEGRAEEALHFRPQHLFLSSEPGGFPEVDFIGRFERLEEDFARVRAQLGISSPPMMRTNMSQSRPASWRKAYSEKTAALVAEVYARDIELFDYTF